MRLVCLLSWFDEEPATLVRCLASLPRAGVSHVVALDGRYALFPSDRDKSPPEQAAAIALACRELGMTVDVRQPDLPWPGEVEKRTALFALGYGHTSPGDWFMVMDADQVVARAPADLLARLAASGTEAADVTFHDESVAQYGITDHPTDFPLRILFRAQQITVRGHHANYEAADGRALWCARQDKVSVSGLDLTGEVLIDHRPQARPTERLLAKSSYYTQRDERGVEFSECPCGARATVKFHGRWKRGRNGRMYGDIMVMCGPCAARQRRKDEILLRARGLDPGSATVNEFYGRRPA